MEFLILLGVFGVLAWMVWRVIAASRARQAASAAREAEMLAQFAAVRAAAQLRNAEIPAQRTPPPAAAAPLAMPPPAAEPAAAPPPAEPRGGARPYLGRHHAVAFRLLRLALPEREVFARSSLRAVLGSEAVSRDLRLDFVVCDRGMRVLAAVDLVRSDDTAVLVELKSGKLQEAGIRYLRWNPEALPAREEVARLLGNPPG